MRNVEESVEYAYIVKYKNNSHERGDRGDLRTAYSG